MKKAGQSWQEVLVVWLFVLKSMTGTGGGKDWSADWAIPCLRNFCTSNFLLLFDEPKWPVTSTDHRPTARCLLLGDFTDASILIGRGSTLVEVDIESRTSWSGEWIHAYLNARIELAHLELREWTFASSYFGRSVNLPLESNTLVQLQDLDLDHSFRIVIGLTLEPQ